jgi:thioredoxin-dependent peroxiredoxin
MRVPDVKFILREQDANGEYQFVERETVDFFGGKRCVIFSLPGAFTPTCTTRQLPAYEEAYSQLRHLGITHVYCISVNDSFVMDAWAASLNINQIQMIPDGNGIFTGLMDQLVLKENLGFGYRSWRYAAVVNDGVIEKLWEEPGKEDNCPDDPYTCTDPQTVIEYLKSVNA